MIPLRDDVMRERIPFMTWGLIIFNVLIFIYQTSLSRLDAVRFLSEYSLVPAAFFHAREKLNIFAPVTSMFLHGNFQHLLSNMWILWLFGDNVEDRMGTFSFFVFYIVTGVLAGFVHVLSAPNSFVPTIGASGAIAGVMGAYMFLFPRAKVLTLIPIFIYPYFTSLPSFLFIGIWFLTQFFYGALSLGGSSAYGGIAWWAHIGGFLAGVLMYRFFLDKKRRYY